MTAAAALARATADLTRAGLDSAGRDARQILAHVLRVPAGRLTLFLPEPLSPAQQQSFDTLIARRAAREPVSHLTGRRIFYGRPFLVTPDVLDPRPETETLIEAALAEPFASVLDLGTGSGAILLTLLSERETAIGVGTDISQAALDVAFWNRNALKLEDRALLRQGDWGQALLSLPDERFDLVVSNPPYIAAAEMPGLAPEVRDHEPRLALTDEGDGLEAYRRIVADLATVLAPSGRVLLEIGPTQSLAVAAMLDAAGLHKITITPDLDGRDRVVCARY